MIGGDGIIEVGSLIAMGMIDKVLKKNQGLEKDQENSAWLPETRWIILL